MALAWKPFTAPQWDAFTAHQWEAFLPDPLPIGGFVRDTELFVSGQIAADVFEAGAESQQTFKAGVKQSEMRGSV